MVFMCSFNFSFNESVPCEPQAGFKKVNVKVLSSTTGSTLLVEELLSTEEVLVSLEVEDASVDDVDSVEVTDSTALVEVFSDALLLVLAVELQAINIAALTSIKTFVSFIMMGFLFYSNVLIVSSKHPNHYNGVGKLCKRLFQIVHA